jgi:hypothetical protein
MFQSQVGRCEGNKRTRAVNDDEVRILWPALDQAGIGGKFVKLLLLTSQLAQLRWSWIDRKQTTEAFCLTLSGEEWSTCSLPLFAPTMEVASCCGGYGSGFGDVGFRCMG